MGKEETRRKKNAEGVLRDVIGDDIKKLQEQNGIIISSVALKPCPSEQSDRRLPEEARAEKEARGERP